MKKILTLSLSVVSLMAASADDAGTSLSTISTLHGKNYQNCTVVRTDPDGVWIRHSTGSARILFTDMPAIQRMQLGYNAGKAEEYEKSLAEKREKMRQAAVEEYRALSRMYAAEAEAQQRRAEERRYLQTISASYGGGYYGDYVPYIGGLGTWDNYGYGGDGYGDRSSRYGRNYLDGRISYGDKHGRGHGRYSHSSRGGYFYSPLIPPAQQPFFTVPALGASPMARPVAPMARMGSMSVGGGGGGGGKGHH